MGLTGMCIFNPSFNLVVVEGSMKGIKQYSRLMLVRMNWTEAARARNTSDDEEDGEGEEGAQPKPSTSAVPQQTDEEAAQSLKDNKCEKVWEGPLRDRAFKGFKARTAPNDTLAREALGGKWAMQWDVAKTFVSEELL
jgi:U4/U6 small nuclear ribonucleoprotein PRP3